MRRSSSKTQTFWKSIFFLLIGNLLRKGFGLKREVAEWSKAHAWKVCIRQKRIEGSNPSCSASPPSGMLQKAPVFLDL